MRIGLKRMAGKLSESRSQFRVSGWADAPDDEFCVQDLWPFRFSRLNSPRSDRTKAITCAVAR